MSATREPKRGECWVHKKLKGQPAGHGRVTRIPGHNHYGVSWRWAYGGTLSFNGFGMGQFLRDFEPCTEHPPLPRGGAEP